MSPLTPSEAAAGDGGGGAGEGVYFSSTNQTTIQYPNETQNASAEMTLFHVWHSSLDLLVH